MNGGELLADGSLISPLLQNIILIVRIYLQYFLFSNPNQPPENDWVVLKSSPVQKCEPITILYVPHLYPFWKILYFLRKLINQGLLLLETQSLKTIDQAALFAKNYRFLV